MLVVSCGTLIHGLATYIWVTQPGDLAAVKEFELHAPKGATLYLASGLSPHAAPIDSSSDYSSLHYYSIPVHRGGAASARLITQYASEALALKEKRLGRPIRQSDYYVLAFAQGEAQDVAYGVAPASQYRTFIHSLLASNSWRVAFHSDSATLFSFVP
jgi:hypothetical protein